MSRFGHKETFYLASHSRPRREPPELLREPRSEPEAAVNQHHCEKPLGCRDYRLVPTQIAGGRLTVIQVRQVTKRFDAFAAVSNLSFDRGQPGDHGPARRERRRQDYNVAHDRGRFDARQGDIRSVAKLRKRMPWLRREPRRAARSHGHVSASHRARESHLFREAARDARPAAREQNRNRPRGSRADGKVADRAVADSRRASA